MSKQYPITSEDIPYNSYKPRAADVPPSMVKDNARKVQTPDGVRYAIGISMLIVGAVFWCLGASASLDGWMIGLNILADAMRLNITIMPLRGLAQLPVIVLVGVLYSCDELYLRPRREWGTAVNIAIIILILITHASDVGSTYLFVTNIAPGAWEAQKWAATETWPAAIYAIALTYAPELLILTAWRMLRGR